MCAETSYYESCQTASQRAMRVTRGIGKKKETQVKTANLQMRS